MAGLLQLRGLRRLSLATLLVALPLHARADLATCRSALLLALDPPAAIAPCNAAVAAAPGDGQARLLRAVATVANIPFLPAVEALLSSFGFSGQGYFPPKLDLLLPGGQLASDSPEASAVQAVAASDVLPALDAARADLDAIVAPFSINLTPQELAAIGVTSIAGTEIDQSDALLLAGVLEAAAAALRIALSYDLDFDIDDAVLRFTSSLDIQQEIVDANPTLLTLRAGAPAQMAAAKQGLCAAVDSYHLAIQAIGAEADPQDDDLIAVGNPQLEAEVSQELARLRASLDRPFRVLVGTEEWKADLRAVVNGALGTSFGAAGATLDLRGLFDAPIPLRPLAPTFGFDPLRIPPSGITSYPDPTFAGALTSAAPSADASASPCPPAVVPEPAGALSGGAVVLGLLALERRRARRSRARREQATRGGVEHQLRIGVDPPA